MPPDSSTADTITVIEISEERKVPPDSSTADTVTVIEISEVLLTLLPKFCTG